MIYNYVEHFNELSEISEISEISERNVPGKNPTTIALSEGMFPEQIVQP